MKHVSVSQENKETFEPPQWLNLKEDIEFSTTCNKDEDPQYNEQMDLKIKQSACNYASAKFFEDWNNLVNKRVN